MLAGADFGKALAIAESDSLIMAVSRKKSGKRAAATFQEATDRIAQYLAEVEAAHLSDQAVTWAYELAIIKVGVAFEHLMLECLVAAVNNDTATISASTGVTFPRHLTDEVCEYLITGVGYFDFKGRSGLIRTIKGFVPESHYLVTVVKDGKFKDSINELLTLRNFAAHESKVSKKAVIRDNAQITRISSAGAWLKKQQRCQKLIGRLQQLSAALGAAAPF